MSFGSVFGALFFGVFCVVIGLRWGFDPAFEARIAGFLLAALGGSLATGLLRRRVWARWAGAGTGLLLTVLGLRLVATYGGVADHVLVFAALATAILLVVPVTGEAARKESPRSASDPGRVGAAGWTAIASFVGLVVVGLWSGPGAESSPSTGARALPASAIGRSISWNEFGPGLERARAESRPVIATFVTDWCPYCSKMTRSTWRASAVVERLDGLVPVKVDAEGSQPTGGFTGRQLAERYGVSGYPAQLLMDGDGSVIARHDGYQTARELVDWIDRTLGAPRLDSPASLAGSGP